LTINNRQYLLGIGIDITERQQIEETLRTSERRLADIINFLPDATFFIDTEGKVVAWNQAIEEISGVKAEDMVGKGEYEYAIPFYGVRRPVLIDLALRWDDTIANKYACVEKNGEILTSETINPPFLTEPSCFWNSVRVLYNVHGDIIGAIQVIRDITDRKQAGDALTESEERFRSLVANIPGALYRCDRDPDWTMRFLSDRIADISGYPSSDLIDNRVRTYTSVIHSDDRAMV
jgi:PAS domain S-box-containing protein